MSLVGELRQRKSFLTTAQVMKLLGLRRNTVCEWVQSGSFVAVRVGNGYRFDPVLLAEWIELRSTGSGRISNRSSRAPVPASTGEPT